MPLDPQEQQALEWLDSQLEERPATFRETLGVFAVVIVGNAVWTIVLVLIVKAVLS